MPKINSIQTAFSGGEFSPMLYGQIHAERYKSGVQTCLNYIPTLQGPLLRRPATKYVNNVKDSANPPALIPFIFSETQAYALEFGDKYIRFYANNGQVVTSSNLFKVSGLISINGTYPTLLSFNGIRTDASPHDGESLSASSVLAAGSALELTSPFSVADVGKIKYTQQNDTIYLVHPNYPPYKMQRFGQYDWAIKPVWFQDGPYLPLNSYSQLGDSTRVTIGPSDVSLPTLSTGPNYRVFGAANNGAGLIRITTDTATTFQTGDKVFIASVAGTTEANNNSSTTTSIYWRINVIDGTHFDLVGSHFVNACVGSTGVIYPALFLNYAGSLNPYSQVFTYQDATTDRLRIFALYNDTDGFRHYGIITGVVHPGQAHGVMINALPNTNTCTKWWLGTYSLGNGYPAATCFHQDRLMLAGAPNYPLQIDGSQTGSYEQFAASGSNLQVGDANAIQFHLLSEQSNPIYWVKSASQGLLAGSLSAEHQITPNSQAAFLTPTNVNAQATSFYGSANTDAVQAGNATIYVQRANRKVRELNYFFQVGTFRSTDLTEISEHITLPQVTKLAVQKETLPMVWGVRRDGNLVSMSYNRDDVQVKAGWARHQLGGQSDSGGTNPVVKSIAVIPSAVNSAVLYDQVWMVVNRSTLSGSTYCSVEYMTRPYDDSFLQEDAFQGDCGATYDSPVYISGISTASSAIVSASSHGFTNGDQLRITTVVGLNSSAVDSYGNTTITNLVNEKTFTVGSALTHTFALLNYGSSAVNSLGYSAYVSGGQARKMVLTISGLNWLNGETIGVLADGANHPDVLVQSGSVTLNYRAAKVQFGYRFNSDGMSLTQEGGSAQGTSLGETRRVHRVAFQVHNVGNLQMGNDFTDLTTLETTQADQQQADQTTPLASGIFRDSIGDPYDFYGTVVWRQNDMQPGMIQSITTFEEVQDV